MMPAIKKLHPAMTMTTLLITRPTIKSVVGVVCDLNMFCISAWTGARVVCRYKPFMRVPVRPVPDCTACTMLLSSPPVDCNGAVATIWLYI